MISANATLIELITTYDEIGQSIYEEVEHPIFCEERAITRQEWAEAGRQGLNPAIELITPFANYHGERIVEYQGQRYSVYRTFRRTDNIELYLELKGGTYGI